jgi:hypothetical protein
MEEVLRVRRVAANVLNKQSRRADKRWSSSLGVGRGATTPHRKNFLLLRNVSKRLAPGLILWHDLSIGDLRDIGIDGANWIQLAQDRVQWRDCVYTVMNHRVP